MADPTQNHGVDSAMLESMRSHNSQPSGAAAMPSQGGIETKIGGEMMVPHGSVGQYLASPGGIVPVPLKGAFDENLLSAFEGNMAMAGIEHNAFEAGHLGLGDIDAGKAFGVLSPQGNLNSSDGASFGNISSITSR